MPLFGMPKKTVSTGSPAFFATAKRTGEDAKASNFEGALAMLLIDLQGAICRQHEFFASQADKRLAGAIEAAAPPLMSTQANQPVDRDNAEPAPKRVGTHLSEGATNQVVTLPVCPADPPVGDGLDKEAPVSAGGSAPLMEIQISEKPTNAAVTAAGVESVEIKATEPQSEEPLSPLGSLPLARIPSLTSFSQQAQRRRTNSNLGVFSSANKSDRPSERTSLSVKRQLDFIKGVPKQAQEALLAGRTLRSSAVFELKELSFDWWFRTFINLAVLSNVAALGFQAEYDWEGWIFVDTAYVIVFFLEMVYRVWRNGVEILAWTDPDWRWHWFDIFLVAMTAVDVVLAFESRYSESLRANAGFGQIGVLRMLRIVRILRIFRLSHIEFFKDLGLMVMGTIGGLRTLLWSLVMIMVPVYAVALFFCDTIGQSTDVEVAVLFSTMSMSLFTTFRCLVLGDCSAPNGTPIFQHVLQHFGWGYIIVYCLACASMTFGLFSVIVAIYVESTMAAAKANEAIQRQRRLEDSVRLSCKIFELVHYIHMAFDYGAAGGEFDLEEALANEMTRETFKEVIADEHVRALLHECDVPEDDFSQLFDICDSDGGGLLSMDEIVHGIRKLRGVPSRSDVVWIMLRVQEVQDGIHNLQLRLDAMSHGPTEV